MPFTLTGALLDACVLGLLSCESTYGYNLTQRLRQLIDISESTLYPVLRRLLKDELLSTFDEQFEGRNRRYYQITDKGCGLLGDYSEKWEIYKKNIDSVLRGESNE